MIVLFLVCFKSLRIFFKNKLLGFLWWFKLLLMEVIYMNKKKTSKKEVIKKELIEKEINKKVVKSSEEVSPKNEVVTKKKQEKQNIG